MAEPVVNSHTDSPVVMSKAMKFPRVVPTKARVPAMTAEDSIRDLAV